MNIRELAEAGDWLPLANAWDHEILMRLMGERNPPDTSKPGRLVSWTSQFQSFDIMVPGAPGSETYFYVAFSNYQWSPLSYSSCPGDMDECVQVAPCRCGAENRDILDDFEDEYADEYEYCDRCNYGQSWCIPHEEHHFSPDLNN